MGLFGFGKSDKEKEQEDVQRHEEAQKRMQEALRKREQEQKAAQARPVPAPAAAPGTNRPAAAGGANPGANVPAAQRPAGTGGGSYTVKSGDSLSKIAKSQLGDGGRWREIYELNVELIGKDPDLIHPGQQLRLPGSAAGASGGTGGKPLA
jgi:nucleoid-associated protein YgaU